MKSMFKGSHLQQKTLQKHIFSTYFNLRMAIGLIAIAFPIILTGLPQGEFYTLTSISAYFYALGYFRYLFIGVLVVIGILLILYKGYSDHENNALNIAGVMAWIIALFPTRPPEIDLVAQLSDGSQENANSVLELIELIPYFLTNTLGLSYAFIHALHIISAIVFFLCIAYVSIFKSIETLEHTQSELARKKYLRIYQWLGIFMIILPLASLFIVLVINKYSYIIFWLEFSAIMVFGMYWIVKSIEIWNSTFFEVNFKEKKEDYVAA